jgi:flavin-dependent dehydrogenase
MDNGTYDTAIIGGGLAGLSLSILLAEKGFSVLLMEKEQYPFHKVCGEYISMESWDFIRNLGLNLDSFDLPMIKKLIVSSPNGAQLHQSLDMGGFGISRYKLDSALKDVAVTKGVKVLENCKAESVSFDNDVFRIKGSAGEFNSKICCGSFGKRSNIDVKWRRAFTTKAANKLNNYIGIKYHIQTDFPADSIALHNFKNGYCGISRIENDQYCLCYLTNADNLKRSGNNIEVMERDVLSANPHLGKIFSTATKLYSAPLTISQVSFDKKTQVENHVLMLGDAAGLITPLCGNGMSMAMHSAKIAADVVERYLRNECSREMLERSYQAKWRKTFRKRLAFGRLIQSFFGHAATTNVFVALMKRFPGLTKSLIRQTHGDPF